MKPVIKQAKEKEIEYFENKLYPLQDTILELIDNESFYLSGGTCLSRYYYNHRYSEDMDFFFDGNVKPVNQFEKEFVEYVSKIKKEFEVEVTISDGYFKRLFIVKDDISLKVEFIYEPYPRIGNLINNKNFLIDSKENIAVNKLTAAYTRKTAKDFFDLYFLLKEFELSVLLKKTGMKLVTPAYEKLILSLQHDFFEGEVITTKQIDEEKFVNFVDKLINDMLEYAKQS